MFQAKETDIFFGNETAAGDIQFGLLNSVRKLPFFIRKIKKKLFFFKPTFFQFCIEKENYFLYHMSICCCSNWKVLHSSKCGRNCKKSKSQNCQTAVTVLLGVESLRTVSFSYLQDLYKVTPAFEILTKGNTQIQASQKPGVPVDSKFL